MEQAAKCITPNPKIVGLTLRRIELAQAELAICAKCKGAPCAKGDYFKPVIQDDDITVEHCEHWQQPSAKIIELPTDSWVAEKAYAAQFNRERRAALEHEYGKMTEAEFQAADKASWRLEQCRKCVGDCYNQPRYQTPTLERVNGHLTVREEYCRWYYEPKNASRMQIPHRYLGKTFADYEVTADNVKAVKLAKWFLSKGERGLYLYGGYGTGKTFLASLIVQEWKRAGKGVLFGDVPGLLDRIKASFDNSAERYQDVFDRYCKCDLLILDDLGAGYLTAWNIGQLYQIINARYNDGRPIIATSNLDLKGLAAALGAIDKVSAQRITSRLHEMCAQGFLGTNDRR